MSKKRTSDESNEASESLHRNAKREKLDLPIDTTLQDLPVELLERILIRVVAMEVKHWKLAKDGWEGRADRAIDRLSSVCEEWKDILATNFFRNELRRTVDGYGQKAIRLDTVHESRIPLAVLQVMTLNDDVFMLSRMTGAIERDGDFLIEIYDRRNMTSAVKDVIPIPGVSRLYMTACSVSDCVYVAMQVKGCRQLSVTRITKQDADEYSILPWDYDRKVPIGIFNVSASGSILIFSYQYGRLPYPSSVGVYNPNGSMQQEVMLNLNDAFIFLGVMEKSNGNLIVSYIGVASGFKTTLAEVDMTGSIVRQYESATAGRTQIYHVNAADAYGRIMISDQCQGIELLDSEFNLIGVYGKQKARISDKLQYNVYYMSGRDEIVRISQKGKAKTKALTFLRFTDED